MKPVVKQRLAVVGHGRCGTCPVMRQGMEVFSLNPGPPTWGHHEDDGHTLSSCCLSVSSILPLCISLPLASLHLCHGGLCKGCHEAATGERMVIVCVCLDLSGCSGLSQSQQTMPPLWWPILGSAMHPGWVALCSCWRQSVGDGGPWSNQRVPINPGVDKRRCRPASWMGATPLLRAFAGCQVCACTPPVHSRQVARQGWVPLAKCRPPWLARSAPPWSEPGPANSPRHGPSQHVGRHCCVRFMRRLRAAGGNGSLPCILLMPATTDRYDKVALVRSLCPTCVHSPQMTPVGNRHCYSTCSTVWKPLSSTGRHTELKPERSREAFSSDHWTGDRTRLRPPCPPLARASVSIGFSPDGTPARA